MNNPKFSFKFSFNFVSFEQTLDEINKPVTSQARYIAVSIIKGNVDVIASFTYFNFSNSLSSSFPSCLKYADVRPVFKNNKNDKENYKPFRSLLRGLCMTYCI